MTSSTGGTSTLTCSAQTGYPLVSEAFTGTRFVEYSIIEYTSSAKTQPSKAETGIGSYNTSTEVLTRTKVLSTWDATDYLPKFGTATAPTALNFGTTSANIDIMVGPSAASSIPPLPFLEGSVGSVSDGLGRCAFNFSNIAALTIQPTSGTVYYSQFLLPVAGPISQVSIRESGVVTGGTPTVDYAIYEVGSDGLPGKRLVNFTQISVGTANTTYTSTALATPVSLIPGWYYGAFLYIANSGSGGSFRVANMIGFGPSLLGNSTNATSPLTKASQTTLNDPATAPDSNTNSQSHFLAYFK